MNNETRLHNPYTRLWDTDTRETYYEHCAVAEQKLGRKLEPGNKPVLKYYDRAGRLLAR